MRERWIPDWADDVDDDVVTVMRQEYLPEMPPVTLGNTVLSAFMEIGPTLHTGMGEARLTQGEIRHYQENMGIRLTPWEVRTIRRLSNDYMYASWLAEKADATPCWQPEYDPGNAAIVAKSLKQYIRDLAKL